MTLKLSVDTIDEVPEAVRSFYEEKDGKFSLKVEGLEDTTALKGALEKERRAARDAQKIAKQFEGLGFSADEIKALVEEKQKAEREAAAKAGDFDKILNQHREGWEKQRTTLEAELNAARASERSAIIGTSLMAALTKAGATEEGIDLMPDRLAARVKFETEDGARVVKIMAADGETPMAGSGKSGLATFDDLVKEALTKWPSLFKASGAGGGGKLPGSGAGGAGNRSMSKAEFEALPAKERAARMASGLTLTD
jgi:DNA-binding transcriptional MerR regulator